MRYARSTLTIVVLVGLAVAALLPVLVILLTLLASVIAAALLTTLTVLVGVIVANIVLILVRHFAFLSYAYMGIQETTMVRLRSTAKAERVEIRDERAMVEIAAGRPSPSTGETARILDAREHIGYIARSFGRRRDIRLARPRSNGADEHLIVELTRRGSLVRSGQPTQALGHPVHFWSPRIPED